MALVTLEQAKNHLRLDLDLSSGVVDDGGQIADLEQKVEQASEIIVDYLKHGESSWDDPETAPKPIQAATLLLLTALWDDREGAGDGDYIKPDGAIARLLVRFRDPAMA